MKRTWSTLLVLSAAFLLACSSEPASNGNANSNTNSNRPQAAGLGVVTADINVVYKAGSPPQLIIGDVAPVSMLIGDKIGWRVSYTPEGTSTPPDATIIIKGFHDGADTNPFGDGSPGQNQFNFALSGGQPNGANDTQTANKKGTYKYSVIVKLNGVDLQWVLDPQVIISETLIPKRD